MLAFRRDQTLLREGDFQCFETREPVLAFLRASGDKALGCVFNLSATPVDVELRGLRLGDGAPRQEATLAGDTLALGPNGFAFLDCVGHPDGADLRSK